jgi:SNF2 family DNA or RNA helicase
VAKPAPKRTRILVNDNPGNCGGCGIRVAPKEGELYFSPLRVACAACALREGVSPGDVESRLGVTVGRDGKERKPYDYQVEDALRVARTRAHLLSHEPGCGKTIISSLGALRSDALNIAICPSSVRDNWCEEISRWRPELRPIVVDSQAEFKDVFPELLQKAEGHVMVGSYGMLPGNPCPGCRSLRARLKRLKKERRYGGSLPPTCMHFSEASAHPDTYEIVLDGKLQAIPFNGSKCMCVFCKREEGRGCTRLRWQANPIPKVDRAAVLLADECHALKNPTSERTKNWRALRKRIWAAGGYVFGLSGYPCEGKPMEYWEVLKSLGLERAAFGSWDNYQRIFSHWFKNKKGRRKPPQGALKAELHERLKRVQILRRIDDVNDQLPPVTDHVIHVDMNAKTLHEVNEAVHRMLAVKKAWEDVQGFGPRALKNPFEPRIDPNERERRRGLYEDRVELFFKERPWNKDAEIADAVREALLHKDQTPSIEELSRIRALLTNAKLAAVTEWVGDREAELEPVLLFSCHVSVLEKIASRPGWGFFHGGLTAKQRGVMIKQFQEGEIEHGLAVSIGAGGEGITLTRSRVVGFIDLPWNPAKKRQALARARRIGSEKHTNILQVKFIAKHAVDKLVVETLKEKEALLDALVW